jgi:hypothetical protein
MAGPDPVIVDWEDARAEHGHDERGRIERV